MALKSLTQFPIFAPHHHHHHHHHHHRQAGEIRFSRWNNANAEKFNQQKLTQKQIEDELRAQKRFHSAQNIAYNYNPAPPSPTTFKSTGTPSAPSSPSIPAKFSKYTKPTKNKKKHPAFQPFVRSTRIPAPPEPQTPEEEEKPNAIVTDSGVCYEFSDAPFVYQYSYTETPKVKPLKLREPLVAPFEFAPAGLKRPWTGRKPLPGSKKKLPEFDSFTLPPPNKKGVKPVQAPGPYLPGSGPKYVRSREEVLGEPLTKEEIDQLVDGCKKSKRQLNMGRDGLTHNMLENIHALWKRRRVCKIKCKGVCTVDMENIRQQLEDKTGGKIIYSKGGVIYLFRGRNYNYKTRPRFPLMLWKPVTPVYPRLIKRVPDGLTLEEASEMRKKGRNLAAICKLAKNGVYCDLVKNVREAFEACELVRIDCQGLNGSDHRKIGAKLKDLVPCVLISFENEHILMWRGLNWKSSLPNLEDGSEGSNDTLTLRDQGLPASGSCAASLSNINMEPNGLSIRTSLAGSDVLCMNEGSRLRNEGLDHHDVSSRTSHAIPTGQNLSPSESHISQASLSYSYPEAMTEIHESQRIVDNSVNGVDGKDPEHSSVAVLAGHELITELGCSKSASNVSGSSSPWTEQILYLQKQAIESGTAVVLDHCSLDADIVFERAVALSKSAPPGPVFRSRPKKMTVQKGHQQGTSKSEVGEASRVTDEVISVSKKRRNDHENSGSQSMKDIKEEYLNVVPQGSLRVDELAKLLA